MVKKRDQSDLASELAMNFPELVAAVADSLAEFDSTRPVHKTFQAGIGPFGEPQLVREIADRLQAKGLSSRTRRTPDLEVMEKWAIEFKIVRPFGDNGREAENWSVNMLHPYPGNTSLIGDALKLASLESKLERALFVIGYEHNPAKVSLDPLINAFELICRAVVGVELGSRVEEKRGGLVHPEHQVVRCIAWELKAGRVSIPV